MLEPQRSCSSNLCGEVNLCGGRMNCGSHEKMICRSLAVESVIDFLQMAPSQTKHNRYGKGSLSWHVQGSSNGQKCYHPIFCSLSPSLRIRPVLILWLSQAFSILSHSPPPTSFPLINSLLV